MDKIALGLLRDTRSAKLSASELMGMGKQASRLHLNDGMPLNDAVVKVASGGDSCLTVEQVTRVAEAANNQTYLALFEKQADNKVVDFVVAEPREIVRALDVSARPAVRMDHPDFFDADPEKLGRARANLEADRVLAKAFGVDMDKTAMAGAGTPSPAPSPTPAAATSGIGGAGPMKAMGSSAQASANPIQSVIGGGSAAGFKAASKGSSLDELKDEFSLDRIKAATEGRGDYPMANPYGNLYRAKQDLQKLADDAKAASSENGQMVHDSFVKLCHEIKQFVLEGGDYGEMIHAMAHVAPAEKVKTAMDTVVAYFAKTDPYVFKNPQDMMAKLAAYEMEKGAQQRVVNLDHPIAGTFAVMLRLQDAQEKLARAEKRVDGLLEQTNATIAKVARSRNAASAQ